MVPTLSIVFMGCTFVFVIAAAVILPILIKKKHSTAIEPYFIGTAVFIVFALILESLMHTVVLSATGKAITGNMWLYALYGGFAAGIFEETGRFLAMKFVMKKHHGNPGNALMYGAGHGCCEAVLLIGLSMLTNISFSVLINSGQTALLLSHVPAEATEQLETMISQLKEMPSYMFLLSSFERVSAIMFHISASVLVWTAVVKKKIFFYPLAIILHAFLDGVLVILQQKSVNNIVLEAVLFVISLGIAVFALLVWKKELRGAATETAETA